MTKKPNDNVQRFINAWKKEFGEELSPEEGRAELNRLCHFFTELAKMESAAEIKKEIEERGDRREVVMEDGRLLSGLD